MDRQLSDYVARLLAHSPQLEKSFDQGRRNVIRDLELLGTLGAIARQSLMPWMETPSAEAAATAVSKDETARETRLASPSVSDPPATSASVPVQSRTRAPDFGSQRAEYKPALRNQELVEALLDFHRRNLPSRGSQHGNFSPQASPEIEVEQKSLSSTWRKSPGIYQPVLRSTKGRT